MFSQIETTNEYNDTYGSDFDNYGGTIVFSLYVFVRLLYRYVSVQCSAILVTGGRSATLLCRVS